MVRNNTLLDNINNFSKAKRPGICKILFLVGILVFSVGCSSKNGVSEKNNDKPGQTTANIETNVLLEPTSSPEPSATPVPEPTATPAPPTPDILDKLDFGKIDGLDGAKKEWGIKLMGNETPTVTEGQRELLQKYNAYYIGDTSKNKIHFLFSAGFEGGYTGQILDTLKKHDVKAIFFLVGDYIEREPELVKRMLDEGHEIGNHSYRHPYLPDISNERLEYEMLEYDKYFRENYNRAFKYFMPPSGVYSEKVLAAAKQMGYTTLFWSFAYVDYDINNQPGPDNTYNIIMKYLHKGAFLFLHTVSRDNAQALDRIITDIKAQNYEIGLVD